MTGKVIVTRMRSTSGDILDARVIWRQVIWADSLRSAFMEYPAFQHYEVEESDHFLIATLRRDDVLDHLSIEAYTSPEDRCIEQYGKWFEERHGRKPTEDEVEAYYESGEYEQDLAEILEAEKAWDDGARPFIGEPAEPTDAEE